MRKIALAMAIATMTIASPAYAPGEGRIEARGGIAFAKGASEASLGAAAGYDFDLGEKAFIGVEGSADKVLQKGSNVLFGIGGRVGVKASDKARLYAIGGYGFAGGTGDPFLGAGAQVNFGAKAFGKLEYRRFISNGGPDLNFATVGFGVRF
jgi:outer membrane immunogenic protein